MRNRIRIGVAVGVLALAILGMVNTASAQVVYSITTADGKVTVLENPPLAVSSAMTGVSDLNHTEKALQDQLLLLRLKLKTLEESFGADHPKVKALQTQIETLRQHFAVAQPAPAKADARDLYDSLKDVINHGASLYNDKGDAAGCYRVFQGALIAVRPYLADNDKLLKHVDASLQKAEQLPKMVDRAFALRAVLDGIREVYRPKGIPAPEKKPAEHVDPPKKGEKTDVKPGVEKPGEVKKDDKKGNEPAKDVGKTDPVREEVQERVTAVAFIHKTIPITREELGEYLTARFGADNIEALVNRRIIELACRKADVFVSDDEVEAQFAEDCRAVKVSEKDFDAHILKRFNKSLFQWKEDIIRPRIAMAKLAKQTIKVEEEDIRQAFATKYGPKVQCRMIVLSKGEQASALKIYSEVKDSEEAFARYALSKHQFIDLLRDNAGKTPPICKHFGDANIEKAAFALKVGEVAVPVEMPDGTIAIMKCDGHVAADESVNLDTVRSDLEKKVFESKVSKKIPELMVQLRQEAAPVIWLRKK